MLGEMDLSPFSTGSSAPRAISIELTTRALFHLRAHELATVDGYIAPHISQDNYEQAKCELGSITEARRVELLQALHAAEHLDLQLS